MGSAVKIDAHGLSRKYRVNVPVIIRAWKKGLSDAEIARRTGCDAATLLVIRKEIEMISRQQRLARREKPG